MKYKKPVVNKVQCKLCGDIIESSHRHDFKSCTCQAVSVDGGHDYVSRTGNQEDYEELSVYEEIELPELTRCRKDI